MTFITSNKSNRNNLNYNFNWLAAMIDYLPIIMRQLKIISFISVPILSLWNVYLAFLNYRSTILFVTAGNGQTIVLEKMLIVLFGEGIKITNIASNFVTETRYRMGETPALGDDQTFVYRKGESIPSGSEQKYDFTRDEVSLNFDFIVYIPSAIISSLNLNQVSAIVNFYKFAGTTYTIKSY